MCHNYYSDYVVVQFIDLCILLGCDYCDSLRGIGPKRAVELIKKHKTLEATVKAIDTEVFIIFDAVCSFLFPKKCFTITLLLLCLFFILSKADCSKCVMQLKSNIVFIV